MITLGWVLIISGFIYNHFADVSGSVFNWGLYVGLFFLLIGLTERGSQLKKQVKQLQEKLNSITTKPGGETNEPHESR